MQEWAVKKLLEWSDWVFLPFDKCDRICSAEKHQISILAKRNDSESCDRSYLRLNGLTWEFHEPNLKFQDDKP